MPLRYIPALVIIIGLTVATVYFYNEESSYISGMEITSGRVVALGGKSKSTITFIGSKSSANTQALVDFTVDGSTYRSEGRAMGLPGWEVGQTVDVYFSEQDPEKSRIKRWDELYFFTAICSFFLGFCLLFATVNFIVYKVRGRPLS